MFRRRVCGPRAVVIAVRRDNNTVVADPAIDLLLSDVDAYARALFAESAMHDHIVFHEGEQPTLWTIKPMTLRQGVITESVMRLLPEEYAYAVMRCTVLRVAHRVFVDDEGREVDGAIQPERKDRGGDWGTCADEEWIAKLNPHRDEAVGLALMGVALTNALDPSSRRSAPASGDATSSDAGSTS